MNDEIYQLTVQEELLLDNHLAFYQGLACGKRSPTTAAQRQFVAVAQGRAKAETEHEIAFAKYRRNKAAAKTRAGKSDLQIPEYEDGAARPGWSDNDDWKKMRANNRADFVRRQRE